VKDFRHERAGRRARAAMDGPTMSRFHERR
jgi:hypothetical protein